MIFGEVDAALSLWGRARRWLHRQQNPKDSVSGRFVQLFETHGVHRNQIPRFIGHGLTTQDIQNDHFLLSRLDEALLDHACTTFAVRREWIDGADEQAHPCHDFYKDPQAFRDFLNRLLVANPEGQLRGVLVAPEDLDTECPEAIVILQETVGRIGEKAIYRFHLLNNWGFAYWKGRGYLTSCVAIAWNQGAYVHGIRLANRKIDALKNGKHLLGWYGGGIWALGHKSWTPEDMTLEPDAFLKGVDAERDNFGIVSALKLWLELDQQGLMESGFGIAGVRERFEHEVRKYEERR